MDHDSLRILCISYEYPPIGGGGATVCKQIAETLVRNGHKVDVVTSGIPDLPEKEVIDGVAVHRVPCIRRNTNHATAAELATQVLPSIRKSNELISDSRPDLIHCHFIVPSGLVAWRVGTRWKVPYILTAHGSDVAGYNPERFEAMHTLIRPVWRRIVNGAAAVTAPSQFLIDLIQKVETRNVELIPNGFKLPELPDLERKRQILMVSRIVERKGLQHLIEALSGMQTDWKLVVAGDGPYLATARAQADRLNLDVEFLGMVDRDRLAELYASSSVFAFPSMRENFPMVVLEAMAAGCAVVTTDADGCREAAGDAAMFCRAGDAEDLRRVLTRLVENEEERDKLRDRALARAKKFSIGEITADYEKLFAAVAQGSGTQRDGG